MVIDCSTKVLIEAQKIVLCWTVPSDWLNPRISGDEVTCGGLEGLS